MLEGVNVSSCNKDWYRGREDLPNNRTRSLPAAWPPGRTPSWPGVFESLRPTLTGTVGPPGHVLMACAAANWMRSATPTPVCEATLARLPHSRSMPRFSLLEHSFARMREPSQAPLKQSWKDDRMAARAASVHWPSARNCSVRVEDIWVQTAGQASVSCLFIPRMLPTIPKIPRLAGAGTDAGAGVGQSSSRMV
jgi:hypothetical protein